MTPRQVVVVAGRHRPHEQLLLLWAALSGLVYLTGAPAPGSLVTAYPAAAIKAWATAMLVSGVVGIVGCWWRGERGLGVEAGGLLINAGALVLYAAAAFGVAGVRALLPGGIVLAWALANVWRSGQALSDLKSIRGKE